jgi:murein endopeptidase
MRCLLGLGSYSTVDTLLPERGSGFYSYASPSYQFGHSKVVEALKSIANAWNDKHLAGPLIGIGEISCNQGGSMVPKHGSHRFGVDVDIRPFRKDGKREPVTHWDDEYSLELTKEFVNLTRNNGFLRVERIFFNDSKINGVEKAEGHDNHLHIRFISPSMAP